MNATLRSALLLAALLVGVVAQAQEPERVKARLQLKTLIFPEGMGERFQVMIQEKNAAASRLTGLGGIGKTAESTHR